MKKTLTHLEQARQSMATMDEQMSALTGLSQEQINGIRFESAFTYLDKVIGTDVHGMQLIPREPGFWGWWRREWYRVDELLMTEVQFCPRLMHHYLELGENQLALTSERRWREAWEVFHSPDPANYRVQNFEGWHRMMREIVGSARVRK